VAEAPVPRVPAVVDTAPEALAAAPTPDAEPPAPAAPAEPVIGQPVQPVVLGTGVEAALPKRQGWWKR
jgi:hypothetical protein